MYERDIDIMTSKIQNKKLVGTPIFSDFLFKPVIEVVVIFKASYGIPLYCSVVCLMVFNATFNNISVISWRSVLLVEETRGPRENHRPVASH